MSILQSLPLYLIHDPKRDAEAMQSFFHQDLHVDQLYHFSDDSPPIPQDYGRVVSYTRRKMRMD